MKPYIGRRKACHFCVNSTGSKILPCSILFTNNRWSDFKIIFMLAYVSTIFYMLLVQLMSLHGEMSQKERTAVYHQFCKTTTKNVLLCTVSIASM